MDSDPFSFESFGRRQTGQVLIDAFLAGTVWLVAHLVLFGGLPAGARADTMWTLLPAVVLAKPGLNFLLGHYRRLWRYTALRDVVSLHAGAVVAALCLWIVDVFSPISPGLSLIIVDAAFFMLAAPGVRLARRVQKQLLRQGIGRPFDEEGEDGDRVLLVGADEVSDALLRDLERSNGRPWTVAGLLDDDPSKHGSVLRGVPVLGATTEMERAVEDERIDRVVIGMSQADEVAIRDLVRRARGTGANVSRLPSPGDLMGPEGTSESGMSSVTLSDLRDVTEVRETLLDQVRVNGSSENSRVLVTGGAGYIGSHLVRRFLREGHYVRVLDSLLYGDRGVREVRDHPNFELLKGDVCNVRDVTTAVKDVDTVVALAAIVGDPACGIDAETTLNLNFESTKILAEACNFYDVDRLVFASTCSVYGAKDDELLTETSSLNPVSLYARTKIMSENVLLERLRNKSTTTPVLLRLATIFGLSPRMRFDLVVNTLTVRAVVDGTFQVFGGDQWRPFIHCSDAAKGFYLAATAPESEVRGEVFNVGSTDLNHQIKQVGEMVAEELPGTKVEFLEKEVDARNYRVSCEKIAKVLDYEPEYDLRGGIRELVTAIRDDQELQDYGKEIYSNVQSLEGEFTPTVEL